VEITSRVGLGMTVVVRFPVERVVARRTQNSPAAPSRVGP
jgi:hypothetical protein